MIERGVVNLKADSIDRSNLNKGKTRGKKTEEKNSFQKALEKEDKNLEKNQEKSGKDLEKKELKEKKELEKQEEKSVKEESENQEGKTKKKEEIIEIVSFLNIKDLPEESKKTDLTGKGIEETKLQGKNQKIETIQINQEELKIQINTEEASKEGKEKVLLDNVENLKGNENLNLKQLNKSGKDEDSEIKLKDIKHPKEVSEKNKIQTLKSETSTDNEFKDDINKELENLKERITSIDNKKEDKEISFNENLKNSMEEAKENINKDKIITEGTGKNIEKPVAGKENIIDQMAKSITTGKTDSGNFIKIQLKPEVLGEMTVKLTEGKEGMIATISAEKEVVKNILRNSGEQITTMLSEKNIKVNNVVIETNESEKQDFNLFSDNSQENSTGEENSQGHFSNNKFSNYGMNSESERDSSRTDEIYSGNGINFYV